MDIISKKDKKSGYEAILTKQYQELKDTGCPKDVIERLAVQRKDVLARLMDTEIPNGNIPVLPDIPFIFWGIYDQMRLVCHNETGHTSFDPSEIKNIIESPKKLNYFYNIEDGTAMLDSSPIEAIKLIKKQDRIPLIVTRGIALCRHTDVLLRHGVDFPGSYYRSRDKVPSLLLYTHKGPGLVWGRAGCSIIHWGSASCDR